MSKRLLIIDDEVAIGQLLNRFLTKNGYDITFVTTGKKGIDIVKKEKFDLVLCDFRLPDMDGLEALNALKNIDRSIKVIIITGYSDVKIAVKCVKMGASEYVTKPIYPEEILMSVSEALKEKEEEAEDNDSPKQTAKPKKSKSSHTPATYIQGNSANSKQLLQVINLLAPTNMSVIIQGESGTGKEMVANEIHKKSERAAKPFVAIDCGALPKELAASELFGHVKGSFTGAINDKTGHFEMANGGTLFLDEIGNLTYENQIKLLRVLQERKIRKIGDNKDIPIDVRLITASNDNLEELVSNGEFREDLFYRLNEFLIDVAPLRERKEDILLYANHFLAIANEDLGKEVEKFDDDVEKALVSHEWQGNLRELKNLIKRAVLLTPEKSVPLSAIPVEVTSPNNLKSEEDLDCLDGLDLKTVAERAEKKAIIRALELNNYNKTKTAKALNVDRKTLYNKLESFEIQLKKSFE